jgi:ketosteroid isomerase-like protein
VSETEDFLGSVLPRLTEADTAFHNGDAAPRIVIWSHNDPVTLFGAALMGSGWTEIRPVFESLASRFSNGTYECEVIAAGASGDLGYAVGIEHASVSVGGARGLRAARHRSVPPRRQRWKVVHRHADPMPDSESARRQVTRLGDTRPKSVSSPSAPGNVSLAWASVQLCPRSVEGATGRRSGEAEEPRRHTSTSRS